ncbi:MAG: hypothetical protein A2104_07915 [Candidatus Melainabacteria bacterium GWF2_32_7]|nr:MAG: hypothetical protein A2104_07915 [Candidatus Melainabacteria bacterium GWF2_32_7]
MKNNVTHNWPKEDEVLIIDEAHVGLLGGFEETKKKIDKIAESNIGQQKIAKAIEIMPISEFYGSKNWGYDGVDWLTAESSYGGVEKFKELIDYAHKKNVKVILDIVPNHLGPFGNVMNDYGQAFDPIKSKTPWGDAINYEGTGNEYMRRALVDMSLYWLNLGVDGLRLDMTKYMYSDIALKLVHSEVKSHFPKAKIINEDSRNLARLVSPLEQYEIDNPEKECSNNYMKRIGADAQWDFDFQHTLEALITGRSGGGFDPSVCDLEEEFKNGFIKLENPADKNHPPKADTNVVYHMSHDESGNHGGKRTIHKAIASKLDIYSRIMGDGKKADAAFFDLFKTYLKGAKEGWTKANNEEWREVQKQHNISRPITKEEFSNAYDQSQALNRLALGTVMVHPSRTKMILMGDDEGILAPLKFFAEYPSDAKDDNGIPVSKKVSDEKGYPVGKPSFEDSKMDQEAYNDPKFRDETIKYKQALEKLIEENPALANGKADWDHLKTYNYKDAKVLHSLRKEGNNEILAVMNFGDKDFGVRGEGKFTLRNIELPDGKWKEILNSDAKEFGGAGFTNGGVVSAGYGQLDINLPKRSMVVFKREA